MTNDDLGMALTGGQLDPAEATKGWDDWLQRPGNRTALLQMGLQLMQPVAIGQTAGGHIAQAIGAGGEAVTRQEVLDQKDEQATNKLNLANQRLAIAQQNADANTSRANTAVTRATARKVGGLTDIVKARFARDDEKAWEKQLDSDAKAIVKQANDVLADPNDPNVKQFKGKTVPEVRDMLRATRPKPRFGAIPSSEDTTSEEGNNYTPESEGEVTDTETPPVAGARLARDGFWYVPDPKHPGRYLKVH